MMSFKEDNQELSARNLTFDSENLKETANQQYPKLNDKNVYYAAIEAIMQKQGQIIALDASEGTGKTHTIRLILEAVRSCKKIALAAASFRDCRYSSFQWQDIT
ncbi:hypothetical protein PoB_000972000 [Plakobranchus ocellatus]|uniref:ATP-dependent DNA helicase n=1 Tax=Plakobranchus ocellatus TaxID=259542 RepID=A0AAV3YL31_9GAST|nr:hypothetical protein PoB_000972000 [Plakobranchus ocellatus]